MLSIRRARGSPENEEKTPSADRSTTGQIPVRNAPIQPNARHVTGRKRPLETRRPFGREPAPFFVSGCVVVIARKLTYGKLVAIPAIAENKNTRRYWEDFWLGDLESNQY